MSARDPRKALASVLRRTGLAFPRGVADDETRELAAAINSPDREGIDLDAMVSTATAVLWPQMQPSIQVAVERHIFHAEGDDLDDLEIVADWASDPDPQENPLARALCVRAATELAGAIRRATETMTAAEASIARGEAGGAIAAATAAGSIVVELLDLDPDDFDAEIVAYIEADESTEALDTLARATGDADTRGWARTALRRLDAPADAPNAAAAMAHLTEGQPPMDPARDAVWVPTMLALVQQAYERALTSEG